MSTPDPTTEKSKKINVINRETVHQICSGQVRLQCHSNFEIVSFKTTFTVSEINYLYRLY